MQRPGRGWAGNHGLDDGSRRLSASMTETLPRLSAALATIVPNQVLAELTAYCPYSPLKTLGVSFGRPGSAINDHRRGQAAAASRQRELAGPGHYGGRRRARAGAAQRRHHARRDARPHPDQGHPDIGRACGACSGAVGPGRRTPRRLRSETIPGKPAVSPAATATRSLISLNSVTRTEPAEVRSRTELQQRLVEERAGGSLQTAR